MPADPPGMQPEPEDLTLIREAAKRRGVPATEVFREGIRLAALGGRVWREPLVAARETFDLGGRVARVAAYVPEQQNGGAPGSTAAPHDHVGDVPAPAAESPAVTDPGRAPLIAVADTSGLIALFNRSDPQHRALTTAAGGLGLLVVSPLVLAELHRAVADHADRATADAVVVTIADLAGTERISLADPTPEQLKTAVALGRLYPETPLDLTDTLTAVLAAEYGTHAVLTVDPRVFGTLSPITEHERFLLLPGRSR